jgi:protein gp37
VSEHTGIEWTDHTFNPWSGCHKVSPACTNCYAAALPPAMRRGAEWGVNTERIPASDAYWRQPLAWDKAATKAGVRRRVFCASVADVFEARDDLGEHRARLFETIERTPNLDWLLLTKRPEEMVRRAPERWAGGWPANVWAGTTVEDQRRADERIPHLLRVPAKVRFLSCEPLLGAIDLAYTCFNGADSFGQMPGISWVIAGGESGRRARPSHPAWFRALRDQCRAAGVPFFFKQWGEWAPANGGPGGDLFERDRTGVASVFFDYNDRANEGANPFRQSMDRVGKKAAGRLLDGVEWSQFPEVA